MCKSVLFANFFFLNKFGFVVVFQENRVSADQFQVSLLVRLDIYVDRDAINNEADLGGNVSAKIS